MAFENIQNLESAAESETIHADEIEKSSSDIFEEEKKKMAGKMEKFENSSQIAMVVAFLSILASLENANPNTLDVVKQGFDFFGASPEWSAVLNIGLVVYDTSRFEFLRKKLVKLKKPKQKVSDVTGSE